MLQPSFLCCRSLWLFSSIDAELLTFHTVGLGTWERFCAWLDDLIEWWNPKGRSSVWLTVYMYFWMSCTGCHYPKASHLGSLPALVLPRRWCACISALFSVTLFLALFSCSALLKCSIWPVYSGHDSVADLGHLVRGERFICFTFSVATSGNSYESYMLKAASRMQQLWMLIATDYGFTGLEQGIRKNG